MIRLARQPDLDRLLEIEHANFPGDHIARASFRRFIHSGRILVETADRVIRGMAVLVHRRGGKSVRLYSLVVDAPYRGQGAADALMASLESRARRLKAERVTLEVRCDNAPAIRFYERLGYTRFATVPDYYEDGGSAFRYVKTLK